MNNFINWIKKPVTWVTLIIIALIGAIFGLVKLTRK